MSLRRMLCGGMIGLVFICGGRGQAAEPRVAFDLGYSIPCRDVTPEDYGPTHPGERIVEAVFRVSMILAEGREEDIDAMYLVIESPPRRLRVADFLPKTQLGSDLAAPIEVVEKNETIRSVEAALGGDIAPPAGPVAVHISPKISARHSNQQGTQHSYKRLPAQSLLLAAGTVKGENGVFFKLRPSSQTSLEGARDFAVRFSVPRDWRGDWVVVTGAVQSHHKWYESSKSSAQQPARMFVSLYQEGDEPARLAAEEVARTQGRLLDQQPGGSSRTMDVARFLVEHGSHPAGGKAESSSPLSRLCDDAFGKRKRPDPAASGAAAPLRQALLQMGRLSAR